MMIVLCGQEEMASRIDQYPEIKSRMYPSALSSLLREEVEELIRYRWKVASRNNGNPLPFQKDAQDAIFSYSKGLPREVCKICDLALLSALTEEKGRVDAEVVHTVAQDLDMKEGGDDGGR